MARKVRANAISKKAKKATKKKGGKPKSGEFIISKSRTKAAASINVSGDFYAALDAAVRKLIAEAQKRATDNHRKTLRPYDL